MDTRTTITGMLLALLGSITTAQAHDLCDADCLLTIDYPAGGSIIAVEPLTITFGDGGLVDTVGSVTAYLDGETLVLNAGESLVFGAGGQFDIGVAGNLDYTDLEFSGGVIDLAASGGSAEIRIFPGGRLAFVDGAEMTIHSDVTNQGLIEVDSSSLELLLPPSPGIVGTPPGSGGTLTISGGLDPSTVTLPGNTLTLNNGGSLGTLAEASLDFGSLASSEPIVLSGGGFLTFENAEPVTIIPAGLITLDDPDPEPDSSSASSPLLLLLTGLLLLLRYRPRKLS